MSKTRFLEQSPYCKILCLDWFSPQLVQIIKVFLTKHIFKEVLHIPHMKQSISFKEEAGWVYKQEKIESASMHWTSTLPGFHLHPSYSLHETLQVVLVVPSHKWRHWDREIAACSGSHNLKVAVLEFNTRPLWDFPGGPRVKMLHFQCRSTGSIPGWGTKTPLSQNKNQLCMSPKNWSCHDCVKGRGRIPSPTAYC